MDQALDISSSAAPLPGLPVLEHEVGTDEVRIVLLPPHRMDASFSVERHIIDVNLNTVDHLMAVNSDKLKQTIAPADSLCFWPQNTSVTIQADNDLPGCVLEVSDVIIKDWFESAEIDEQKRWEHHTYSYDPIAADLGRAAISYMLSTADKPAIISPLTTEAFGLGIASRLMARMRAGQGSVEEELAKWSNRGDKRRIECAIEWVEANIGNPKLSVTEMAVAANLSTCHFATVFKSFTGHSPYSFILRRRATYARDLIVGTNHSLADIAYRSGFSSQAHMTTIVKRHFGATPGAMRQS